MTIRLKGCARCNGDFILEEDYDGRHWICLQCGNLIREDGLALDELAREIRHGRGRRKKIY